MWGRYLPLLARAGAELVIVTHPHLMRLFETLGYRTADAYTDRPIPESDFWTHFGSVPLHLGAPTPPPAHYLNVPCTHAGGGGVLADASQPERSLRNPLRNELLSLGLNLDPSVTGALDFLDTAQIVAGLDLVISVDTAVVNLAAALGRPTWALLPPKPDFRWGVDGQSFWYSDVRQFRLNEPDDWKAVMAALRNGGDVQRAPLVASATRRDRARPIGRVDSLQALDLGAPLIRDAEHAQRRKPAKDVLSNTLEVGRIEQLGRVPVGSVPTGRHQRNHLLLLRGPVVLNVDHRSAAFERAPRWRAGARGLRSSPAERNPPMSLSARLAQRI